MPAPVRTTMLEAAHESFSLHSSQRQNDPPMHFSDTSVMTTTARMRTGEGIFHVPFPDLMSFAILRRAYSSTPSDLDDWACAVVSCVLELILGLNGLCVL